MGEPDQRQLLREVPAPQDTGDAERDRQHRRMHDVVAERTDAGPGHVADRGEIRREEEDDEPYPAEAGLEVEHDGTGEQSEPFEPEQLARQVLEHGGHCIAGSYGQGLLLHGISRTRDGRFRVRLLAQERELLRRLPDELRDLLGEDDPSLVRLFPPAYPEDDRADEDYRGLVRGELLDGKLAALRTLQETADADRLDEKQLSAWLGALESLRLVLGTQLDVSEEIYGAPPDPHDPQAAQLALYGWLSWLQEEVVQALASALPAR